MNTSQVNLQVQKEKEEGDADADGVDLEDARQEVEPRDVASGGSIGQRVNVRRRSTRSSSGSRADKRRKTTIYVKYTMY